MQKIIKYCVMGIICFSITVMAQNTWTKVTSSSVPVNGLSCITYAQNQFVGADGGTIYTSPDAQQWTKRPLDTTTSLVGIAFENNQYVAVGYRGTIYTSPDAITWIKRTSGIKQYLRSVAYGNNTYVAVGDSGTILTSSDGITWTSRVSGVLTSLYGIAYGNNMFVAVGWDGTILT